MVTAKTIAKEIRERFTRIRRILGRASRSTARSASHRERRGAVIMRK
jgi:hypothetical protein